MDNFVEFITNLVNQITKNEQSKIIEYLYLVILLQNYLILINETNL
jgi:hypothetical protein